MAFLRCGGKAQAIRTTLWSNSNLSASFAGQTITLSENISNFDYIEVVGDYSTSDYSEMSTITKPGYLLSASASTSTTGASCCLTCNISGGGKYARQYRAPSNTTLVFNDGGRIGASGTYNGFVIPYKVIGIKY